MNEIDHFLVFVLYSDDVTADLYHLHIKKIHLVDFSYIVIEDLPYYHQPPTSSIAVSNKSPSNPQP
jgi:hypothetical protein